MRDSGPEQKRDRSTDAEWTEAMLKSSTHQRLTGAAVQDW